MIVPMKKISLITLEGKKEETLKKLRSLGIVHIEISEVTNEKISEYTEKTALLNRAIFAIGKNKSPEQQIVEPQKALEIAREIDTFLEEKNSFISSRVTLIGELERLKSWGDIDVDSIEELQSKGVEVALYEVPKSVYNAFPDTLKTIKLSTTKSTVRFLMRKSSDEKEAVLSEYQLTLPKTSTEEMREKISQINERIVEIDKQISAYACYT